MSDSNLCPLETPQRSTPELPRCPTELGLRQIWPLLTSGRGRVVASYVTETNCHLEIEATGRTLASSSASPAPSIIERILLGEPPKAIAFNLDCAPSTVAAHATGILKRLGLDCTARTVPTSIIMLVHASCGHLPDPAGEVSVLAGAGSTSPRWLVTLVRPSSDFGGTITPAERAIIELLIEGGSYRDMALKRGASPRTVANQLAALHRKLGVSGRICLIGRLLQSKWPSAAARLDLTPAAGACLIMTATPRTPPSKTTLPIRAHRHAS